MHHAKDRQLAITSKSVVTEKKLVFGAFWSPEGCDSYGSGSFLATKGSYNYNDGTGPSPYTSVSISMTLWSECSETSETRTTIDFEGDFSDTPGAHTFTMAQMLTSAKYRSKGAFNSTRTVALCPKTCSPVSGHCDIGDCDVELEDFQPLTFTSTWTATDKIMNFTEAFTESGPHTYTSRTTTGQSTPASIAGVFKLNGVVLDFDNDLNGVIATSKTIETHKYGF